MGGVDRQNNSQQFEGGEITAFMGGGRLDLTHARLDEAGAEIQIFAMWGGYEIQVPPDWEVRTDVLPLLGAVEDKRTLQDKREDSQVLVLKGVVIMGGVEVKS